MHKKVFHPGCLIVFGFWLICQRMMHNKVFYPSCLIVFGFYLELEPRHRLLCAFQRVENYLQSVPYIASDKRCKLPRIYHSWSKLVSTYDQTFCNVFLNYSVFHRRFSVPA